MCPNSQDGAALEGTNPTTGRMCPNSQDGAALEGTSSDSSGLALFDFDGTLTSKDSFLDFLLFAVGVPRTLVGGILMSPWIVGHSLGLIGNGPAKERIFRHFFAGCTVEGFSQTSLRFALERIPPLLRPEGLARLEWHKSRNHRIVVISASLEDYLSPWCIHQGVELLGTRVEALGGKLTGSFSSPNCHGAEKVRRLRELLDPGSFSRIYAYGDSSGDTEMLALAHEPYYRVFPEGTLPS